MDFRSPSIINIYRGGIYPWFYVQGSVRRVGFSGIGKHRGFLRYRSSTFFAQSRFTNASDEIDCNAQLGMVFGTHPKKNDFLICKISGLWTLSHTQGMGLGSIVENCSDLQIREF